MQPVNTSLDSSAIASPATHHEEHDNRMFGFVVFLLSESVIFFSFFAGYIVYKTTSLDWLPTGVTGLEIKEPAINTLALVSSSFVIYFAEKFLHKNNLWGFRAFWLLTISMGSYFLYGQAVEWSGLPFGFGDGVFGGTFYLLTGFHGLHVLVSSWVQGEKAPKNPWRAIGLEWLVSSPPSHENFEELPIVIAGPYGYGKDEPLISNPDKLEVVHATP